LTMAPGAGDKLAARPHRRLEESMEPGSCESFKVAPQPARCHRIRAEARSSY